MMKPYSSTYATLWSAFHARAQIRSFTKAMYEWSFNLRELAWECIAAIPRLPWGCPKFPERCSYSFIALNWAVVKSSIQLVEWDDRIECCICLWFSKIHGQYQVKNMRPIGTEGTGDTTPEPRCRTIQLVSDQYDGLSSFDSLLLAKDLWTGTLKLNIGPLQSVKTTSSNCYYATLRWQ